MSGAASDQGTKPQAHTDSVEPCSKTAQTPSSTDTGTASTAEGGSNEDQQATPGGSERTGSPEPNCAICLGTLENKSFTDSCFHMFCFVCLQEWSKVKPECPLCKQPFKSIIHNVKSYNKYDQFYLEHPQSAPQTSLHFGWNLERSFHYRTTLTMDHRYYNARNLSLLTNRAISHDAAMELYRRPSPLLPRYRLRSRTTNPRGRLTAPVSTADYRQRIYASGRRVSGVRTTQRRRVVSPDFFRSNPAQTHRLVPWLNRELNALLYNVENQVQFVLELIMDLIKRFPIDSEEFYEHIHPYFHHNTRHFMHEFLSFARSPYTMQTYDTRAIYEEPAHAVSSSSSSSNDNSDVVVVVDDDDDDEQAGMSGQSRSPRAEVLNPWHSSGVPTFPGIDTPSLGRSRWDSPTPGPSWDLSGNSSQSPVNVDDSSDSDASTIINQAFIPRDLLTTQPPRSSSPAISDGEEVIFVSYDKPWEERSPIQLSSGSDDESRFVRALKQEHKRKKKSRSSAISLDSDRRSRSRDRSRSRSLSPPVLYPEIRRSRHSRSSSHDHHSPNASKSRQDRHHRRKRRHESTDGTHRSSSQSSHREKRNSSNSTGHNKLPFKKRRHDKSHDGERTGSDVTQKKHKHKRKHKKSKDRHDKRLKRRQDGHQSSSRHRAAESATSSSTSVTRRLDHCKKHPSGHKKSRVKDAADGNETETKEGSNDHHSDCLMSDTSTSSSSTTVPTTSFTDIEQSVNKHFSRQQRVQQVLQERQRQAYPVPLFPGMDIQPSWENISRIASLLAAHTSSQLTPMPGPSQSSDDPVVISASSDESDSEVVVKKPRNSIVRSDTMKVAKTVVVPCSSRYGTPAAAIDLDGASTSKSVVAVSEDDYIDVDSISSDEIDEGSESEVVDVESIDDTDDSSMELISSSEAQDASSKRAKADSVMEVSAETEHVASPQVIANLKTPTSIVETPSFPCPMHTILNRDVFMGVDSSSQSFSRQASVSSAVDMPPSSQDFTFSHSQLQSLDPLPDLAQIGCEVVQARFSQPGNNASKQGDETPHNRSCPSSLFSQQSVENREQQGSLSENTANCSDKEGRNDADHHANIHSSTTGVGNSVPEANKDTGVACVSEHQCAVKESLSVRHAAVMSDKDDAMLMRENEDEETDIDIDSVLCSDEECDKDEAETSLNTQNDDVKIKNSFGPSDGEEMGVIKSQEKCSPSVTVDDIPGVVSEEKRANVWTTTCSSSEHSAVALTPRSPDQNILPTSSEDLYTDIGDEDRSVNEEHSFMQDGKLRDNFDDRNEVEASVNNTILGAGQGDSSGMDLNVKDSSAVQQDRPLSAQDMNTVDRASTGVGSPLTSSADLPPSASADDFDQDIDALSSCANENFLSESGTDSEMKPETVCDDVGFRTNSL